ncbi:MAG: hypothetical protein PHI44_03690 [Candidatus Ratteibacteria bacterium]|nr:hypothetical protein [Candidatus Ratteibacteria bacterium]
MKLPQIKLKWREMDKGKRKKAKVISGIIVLIVAALVTTIYGVSKIPPNFEKLSDEKVLAYVKSGRVEKLDQEHLIKLGERLEKIPSEQRREMMQGLTDEERRNFRESRMMIAEAHMQKTIDEFFSLPPEKQNEFLDRQIDEMEKRRQEFRQRFGERPGGFPQGFQGERPGQSGERREGVSTGNQQAPQQSVRTGRGRPSPDARLQRMRNRLSETTPEERAKRREYARRLRERMMARRRSR